MDNYQTENTDYNPSRPSAPKADAKAAELRALCDAATPGPWEADTTPNEGEYGYGAESHSGFSSYNVSAPSSNHSFVVICDTLNSDCEMVEEDYDEDGCTAWDEVARKNMAFIAAARTAIPALLDEREELIKERDRIARDLKMYRGDVCGTWRCFQCDKVFTNRSDAQRHFGWWPADKPMCVNEHAGDESYWRDRYVELDKIHDDTNRKNFERWTAEKTRADTAEAERDAALSREKVRFVGGPIY